MCNDTACISPNLGVAASTFMTAIQYFMTTQSLMAENWPKEYEAEDLEEFDFIIIGSGSAGSAMAYRLSEIESWNILLIEAGGDPPLESSIPFCDDTMYGSTSDWNYTTTDNGITNKANVNNTVNLTRGKMLGGCSGLNVMLYIRGNDNDYQTWCDAGNVEWDPTIVKQYFKKAENFQDTKLQNDSITQDFYGCDGPLIINTFNSTYTDLTENVLASWGELGIPRVSDLNIANSLGAGRFRVTAANGVRQSTCHTYLKLAENRTNLKILKHALATKLIITNDNDTYTAQGVEVQHNGTTKTFYANKEVIVSAGTINSPQLLMLSGLGPKEHLEATNVTCLVDLPMVGQNLQDHALVPVTIYGSKPGSINMHERNFGALLYLYNQTGHLAHSSYSDISAFYADDANASYPDFQNHMKVFNKNSSLVASTFSFYRPSVVDSIVEQNVNNALYYFAFNLLHPNSRGNVSLKSNDPNVHPKIYWNSFEDERDLDLAVKGIKRLTQIVNTTYFQSIDGFLGRMNWTECNAYDLDSEDYWSCICINMAITIWHPVGTCKMGTDCSSAVVNSRLQVFGVDNLRVVDASIMPETISGNTNAASIMIGERGADIIKEDHGML